MSRKGEVSSLPLFYFSTKGEQMEKMITVKELAAQLGCSERTIMRRIDAGELPEPVRFGKLLRWPEKSLQAWINKRFKEQNQ